MSVLSGLYISKLRIREIGGTSVRDQYGRIVDYMRVSITDRCNLRCRYCMPEGIELVSMEEILTYEEIERICTAAAKTGIRKLKITGGEPLVRLGCAELIGRLKQIPGMEQVTLTTNGVLLKEQLPDLKAAGLDAVNISLDSLAGRVIGRSPDGISCRLCLRALRLFLRAGSWQRSIPSF